MNIKKILKVITLGRLKGARKLYLKRIGFIKSIKDSDPVKKKVVFFSEPNWYPFIVGLATLFRKAGHHVEIWLNEEFDFHNWPVYKESFVENKQVILFEQKEVVLKLLKFRAVPNYNEKNKDTLIKDLLVSQIFFDCQYYDENGWSLRDIDSQTRKRIIDNNINAYCFAYKNIKEIVEKNKSCKFITVNGKVSLYGVFFKAAKAAGVDIVSIDMWEDKDSIVYDGVAPCVSWNTDIKTEGYEKVDETLALEFFKKHNAKRMVPPKSNENTYSMQKEDYKPENILPDENCALMCTNVTWDSAILDKNTIFTDMIEWIDWTIKYFEKNRHKKLIIRCHPVESTLSKTIPVHEIIMLKYGGLPPNIKLIKGVDKENTYKILNETSLLLVYTGTIGLEAAAMNKKVIVAGNVHYANRGFVTSPNSKENYITALNMWAKGNFKGDLDSKMAMKYYSYYFTKFGLHVGNLWTDENGQIPDKDVIKNLIDQGKIEHIVLKLIKN